MTHKLRTPRLHPQAGEKTASSTATHQNTTHNKFSHLEILYKVKLSSKYFYILLLCWNNTTPETPVRPGSWGWKYSTHLSSRKNNTKKHSGKNTENGKAIQKETFLYSCAKRKHTCKHACTSRQLRLNIRQKIQIQCKYKNTNAMQTQKYYKMQYKYNRRNTGRWGGK